jgi:cytidine deaminase
MTDKALPAAALYRDALVAAALAARKQAYAPYSKYQVGAAILTESGRITPGCNVENASYGLCNCAERTAIFTAACAGERTVVAVAVATEDGGTPCGACRQVLAEFSPRDDTPLVVLLLDRGGTVVTETTLSELLPMAFILR